MKILKWYAAILVTFGAFAGCYDALEYEDYALFFGILVLFAPVVYYLWRLVAKEDVQRG